jgi:mRNA-degrading endonuclease RelE of RelBE toxin-antitoxin system
MLNFNVKIVNPHKYAKRKAIKNKNLHRLRRRFFVVALGVID